jgi:glycosyltransferase involved in cell wall biosynthesis
VLEKLAMTLGIADKIEWRGTKTGNALLEEIKTCGIAVAPSITPEPLGIVVLELMTAGRPMIVSADTGLSECAGSAGFAVPRGDDQKLAEVMELLLTDERTREEAVRNSLRRSRQFDPEFSVRQYAALFDVIKARRRR